MLKITKPFVPNTKYTDEYNLVVGLQTISKQLHELAEIYIQEYHNKTSAKCDCGTKIAGDK